MTQLTVAERTEAGQRRGVGRCRGRPTADWSPRPRAPRPGGLARGAGRRPRSRGSCRSATPGCRCPRSRSIGGRPRSWPPTSPRRPPPTSTSSSVVTPTCPTSVPPRRPERRLVFDQNDFDETLPGPWEWDLKRLAASVMVARQRLGSSRRGSRRAASEVTRSYRDAMAGFAAMGYLPLWYDYVSVDDVRSISPALPCPSSQHHLCGGRLPRSSYSSAPDVR